MNAGTIAAELREGLAKATPGEWEATCWWAVGPGKYHFVAVRSQGNDEANARHIARCSPDRIATLLDAYDAMAEALKGIVASADATLASIPPKTRETIRQDQDTHFTIANAAILPARAALAKAQS